MRLFTKLWAAASAVTLAALLGATVTTAPAFASAVPTPTPAHQRLTPQATAAAATACTATSGFTPGQVARAYGLKRANTAPLKVGIAIAFHYPALIADVNAEIKCVNAARLAQGQAALPLLSACKTAAQKACVAVTDAFGTRNYPATDPNWGLEEVLDVYTVFSLTPKSRIIVSEASQATYLDADGLGTAIATTVRLGAKVVNMSWGSQEWSSENDFTALYLSAPGVRYVSASGDGGFSAGPGFPAVASSVISVGGTSLSTAPTGLRSSETAWSGSGSGCSLYVAKPSDQLGSLCGSMKYTSDVSALADPSTGLRMSYAGSEFAIGGTSVASPIIASVYAQAGSSNRRPGSAAGLFDVTAGANGTCVVTIECTAGPGLDGPTGFGTPNGLAAFKL